MSAFQVPEFVSDFNRSYCLKPSKLKRITEKSTRRITTAPTSKSETKKRQMFCNQPWDTDKQIRLRMLLAPPVNIFSWMQQNWNCLQTKMVHTVRPRTTDPRTANILLMLGIEVRNSRPEWTCGSFGCVVSLYDTDSSKLRAVKIFQLRSRTHDYCYRVYRELSWWSKLHSSFVLSLYGTFQIDDRICAVTEDVFGSLLCYTQTHPFPSEERVCAIMLDLCRALHYLHNKKVAHTGLAMDNILICRDMTVKLSGFSFCVNAEEPGRSLELSSSERTVYSAPETCQGTIIPFKLDIYTLGVIEFILMTHKYPFSEHRVTDDTFLEERFSIWEKIEDYSYRYEKLRNNQERLKDLLNFYPQYRPRIGMVEQKVRWWKKRLLEDNDSPIVSEGWLNALQECYHHLEIFKFPFNSLTLF